VTIAGGRDNQSVAYGALNLNLTRFVRYQKIRALALKGSKALYQWEPILFADQKASAEPEEFQLGENDNWITPSSHRRVTRPAWSSPILRKYVFGTFRSIFHEFERTAGVLETELEFDQLPINLKKAECYWEFSDPTPVTTINRLLQPLGTITEDATERVFNYNSSRKRQDQTISYGYKLARGVWLHIYAKTNRRVRFEVRYDFSESAKMLEGKHTCVGVEGYFSFLEKLRADAADRLSKFLDMIRLESEPPQYSLPVTEFLLKFVEAVKRPNMVRLLLQQFINEKGVRVVDNSPLKKYLHKLNYAGVVFCRSNVYRLQPQYRNAAKILETLDLIPIIGPEVRVRTRRRARTAVE